MSQIERLCFIDRTIRERGGIRLRDIADRFEISERQAKRDLEYLRDRLDAPLVWNHTQRRYQYETAWRDLVFADGKALFFSVFARAAAGTLAYVPLAETETLERLRLLVPPRLRGLEMAIRYELPGYEPADEAILERFLEALENRQGLELRYRDLEGKTSERRIVPRRIVNYAGTWYCIAFDPGCGELRTFRFARILHLGASTSCDQLGPEESAVDAFIDASYGMFKGRADKHARVRFYNRAREIVRGELWHPEQSAHVGQDAEHGAWYELDLPVSGWDEILGRILRFGADAEAVAPEEFRERWLEAIDALTARAATIRAGQTVSEASDQTRAAQPFLYK